MKFPQRAKRLLLTAVYDVFIVSYIATKPYSYPSSQFLEDRIAAKIAEYKFYF